MSRTYFLLILIPVIYSLPFCTQWCHKTTKLLGYQWGNPCCNCAPPIIIIQSIRKDVGDKGTTTNTPLNNSTTVSSSPSEDTTVTTPSTSTIPSIVEPPVELVCLVDSPFRPCFRVDAPAECNFDGECTEPETRCCHDTCLTYKTCKPALKIKGSLSPTVAPSVIIS